MSVYKRITVYFLLSLFFLPSLSHIALAAGIAKVIALTGGVTVERGGQSQPLALKGDLLVNDTVRTDSAGRVQLLFSDNSTVSVGENSSFAMEDYSDGARKAFKSNVAVGFVRFVTGAVVENNPEAFSVRTPEATVGIRGTTLAIMTRAQRTIVSTENSLKQQSVMVKDVIIPPGHEAEFGPNASLLRGPEPMGPARRQELVDSVRIATIFTGVALAENKGPEYEGMEKNELPLGQALLDTRVGELAHESALNVMNTGNTFTQDVNAIATGSFEFEGFRGNDTEGSFSFEANLTSGALSNANFTTTNAAGGNFNVSGGTGTATANGFTLSGGNASYISPGSAENTLANWGVNGDDPLQLGEEVEGDLSVNHASPTGASGSYSGEIEGQLQRK